MKNVMKITKAIIPVAGWGTRRLPITKAIEKCMLPIGNRPIVDYVVEDCIQAGIRDIYFVVGEQSSQIKTYYGENKALTDYLIANGKADKAAQIAPHKDVAFHYIIQPAGKYGTAVPVALCADQIDLDESVVVLMGDDFIYNANGSSEVSRLIAGTPEDSSAMLTVEVPLTEVHRYGVFELNKNHEFIRIVDTPTPEEAPSQFINISKYVLNGEARRVISRYYEGQVAGEYQVTEAINQYVQAGGVLKVIPARGEYLDGGNLKGWLHANEVVCRSA
jgi:UTP--glucose-1-phosphate uridylyltransferase